MTLPIDAPPAIIYCRGSRSRGGGRTLSALLERLEQNLDEVRAVLFRAGVRVALLFGSSARGDKRAPGDLDLALYRGGLPMAEMDRRSLEQALMRLLRSERIDLVVLDGADPVLKREVLRDGRVLFERERGDHDALYSRIFREYADTAKFRRYRRDYLNDWLQRSAEP